MAAPSCRDPARPSSVAERVVDQALSWIGTPYCHQGRSRGIGCDCLGLVIGVWRAIYAHDLEDPGPYSSDWTGKTDGRALLEGFGRHFRPRPVCDAGAGDVILLRWRPHFPVRHVGILVPGEAFVHAYEGSRAVTRSPLVPQWRRRIGAAFAFPDPGPTGP